MRQRILFAFLILAVLLAGCRQEPVETTPPTEPPVEHLTMVVSDDTIGTLEEYPDLKSVDLSGSTCYAAIARYIQEHPKVAVTYTVQLGSVTVSDDETALILDPGACDYETLVANLEYLPKITRVQLPRTSYTPQELAALEGLFPRITWDYSVILLGQELTRQTESFNLSLLISEQVAETTQILRNFPNLVSVELMDAYGQCGLTKEEIGLLMDALPQARFHYVFDLFGKTVSTDDTRIEFEKVKIGDAGEEELRAALGILRRCEYLLLDDCGISNEVLAGLREDFRETTQVVWRIWFGVDKVHTCLTDTDTVRATYNLTDRTAAPLRYCENVKYLDLGRNAELCDISFIAAMPELEICILSHCPIADLEPFAGKEKLIFLELAHCSKITDVDALAGCSALEHLNLSFTAVTDLAALWDLPLKQFCAVVSQIPFSEQTTLTALKPECDFRFDGTQPYGTGWYYTKSGIKTDIYNKILEVFDLDA